MAKFKAYSADTEVPEIAKKLIEKYPELFKHIIIDKIGFVTDLKRRSKSAIKVQAVGFPHSIWNDHVYIFTSFQDYWSTLEPKARHLAVAQALFSIHPEGFAEESKGYGKMIKPNINTFLEIYSMAGGIPNWQENPQANDPLK